ncbi:hypothetical protein BS47DRAFT_926823 [Hydnum rufescens UP504]|uniref:Uncharacterized protein n=1 Tax=Hydnum rufescens UP504 TaxID=1448309 RepID=A0A9P6BAT6_9AGAM|nr:hypothetical protein BS47DRAFT_926823 [Hydnum rufescens UP504]
MAKRENCLPLSKRFTLTWVAYVAGGFHLGARGWLAQARDDIISKGTNSILTVKRLCLLLGGKNQPKHLINHGYVQRMMFVRRKVGPTMRKGVNVLQNITRFEGNGGDYNLFLDYLGALAVENPGYVRKRTAITCRQPNAGYRREFHDQHHVTITLREECSKIHEFSGGSVRAVDLTIRGPTARFAT